MKIGTIDLGPRPVLLAPMEDVTDIGFRLLCRRMGASMVYSEFVAADALVRMVGKSLDKLRVCDEERPVAIQIYGKDPVAMRDAAQIVVEKARPDVLDINFGCPVKRVAGKGSGADFCRMFRACFPSPGPWSMPSVYPLPPRPVWDGTRNTRSSSRWPSSCRTAAYRRLRYTAARGRRCTPERPTGA